MNLDTVLADKLAAVGLVPKREKARLAALLDCYITGRCHVKFTARLWHRQTWENPVAFPGTGKALHEISEGDAEDWRLIVALARSGGLRCPSEHPALRWRDIDWEHGRIKVTSPKTARHPNGGSTVIPLFLGLRPYLAEAFDLAEPGASTSWVSDTAAAARVCICNPGCWTSSGRQR